MSAKNNQCCPPFHPHKWDNRLFEWDYKKFLKGKVLTFFYIPLNFGSVIKKMMTKVEKARADLPEYLCLSDHTSKWNMDLLLAVDKDIPGEKMVKLNGKFFSLVYEGDFRKTGEWMRHYENYTKAKGLEVGKIYMWYTTCPGCAKKYGKNYVVIVGQLK